MLYHVVASRLSQNNITSSDPIEGLLATYDVWLNGCDANPSGGVSKQPLTPKLVAAIKTFFSIYMRLIGNIDNNVDINIEEDRLLIKTMNTSNDLQNNVWAVLWPGYQI